MRHAMTFEGLRALKQQTGIPIKNMLALAPQNDPYNIGTPADVRDAEWFMELYNRLGFSNHRDVHIRRVHYRAISQEEPLIMPDGQPYENTKNCWAYITRASKYARYLKLIDITAFDDRRNGKPFTTGRSSENPSLPASVTGCGS